MGQADRPTPPTCTPSQPLLSPMDPQYQYRLLDEIDARQDEVIQQLDELNDQIEAVIGQIVDQRGEGQQFDPAEPDHESTAEQQRAAA